MSNNNHLPYETIVRATNGEPEAVNMVLAHYDRFIKFVSLTGGGHVDVDTEEQVKAKLIQSLFKFRLDR